MVAEQQAAVLAGALEPSLGVELIGPAGRGFVDDRDELEVALVVLYLLGGAGGLRFHL